MDKVVSRFKGIFTKGKDMTTVVTDTTALITIGIFVLWIVCDWYSRSGPPFNTRFQTFYPRSLGVWIVICILIGIYTSKEKSPGDKDKK